MADKSLLALVTELERLHTEILRHLAILTDQRDRALQLAADTREALNALTSHTDH